MDKKRGKDSVIKSKYIPIAWLNSIHLIQCTPIGN